MLVYVAATRASRSLVVTFPATDEAGKELRVSPFAADLRSACPDLIERRLDDLRPSRQWWPLLTSADLAAGLEKVISPQ